MWVLNLLRQVTGKAEVLEIHPEGQEDTDYLVRLYSFFSYMEDVPSKGGELWADSKKRGSKEVFFLGSITI